MDAFSDVNDVIERLREHGYVADIRLATAVHLATRLEKPVLVEGPAGVGKTELAKVLAAATGRRLVRLQCYEGQDDTKALYEWDYGKQLLYTQLLRERIESVLADVTDLAHAADRLRHHESTFFSEHFLVERPLLEAIRSAEPTVLLIDEIDRADEHLEALMLEVLAEFQVTIPELGTLVANTMPFVIITSNSTRELSEALKRRCLHISLTYPSAERELEILSIKVPDVTETLRKEVVEMVRSLRTLDLRKSPSIGEALDWARALAVLSVESLDQEIIEQTLMLLVKYDKDLEKVSTELPRLLSQVPRRSPGPRPGEQASGNSHGEAHHDHEHDKKSPEREAFERHERDYFKTVPPEARPWNPTNRG